MKTLKTKKRFKIGERVCVVKWAVVWCPSQRELRNQKFPVTGRLVSFHDSVQHNFNHYASEPSIMIQHPDGKQIGYYADKVYKISEMKQMMERT